MVCNGSLYKLERRTQAEMQAWLCCILTFHFELTIIKSVDVNQVIQKKGGITKCRQKQNFQEKKL